MGKHVSINLHRLSCHERLRDFSFDTAMTPGFNTCSEESVIVPSQCRCPAQSVGFGRIANRVESPHLRAARGVRRAEVRQRPSNWNPLSHPAAELGPVGPSERIAELDILRGFALLGILVVNLFTFHTPLSLWGSRAVELYPAHPLDKAVMLIENFFIVGNFRAVFAFLFGVGFAIQMDRAAAGRRRSPGCT